MGMSNWRGITVLAGALLAVAAGPAPPAAAQRSPAIELQFAITDKDVDTAIERLQNYLWTRQQDDGSWADVTGSHFERKIGGTTALCVLALLEAGARLNDPRMEKALKSLMSAEMNDLYCYSVRVMALCQAYRFAQRKEFAAQIAGDLSWLTANLPAAGAWGYKGPDSTGDNSCSQYGLLALWEADWAGFDENATIPKGTMIKQSGKEADVSTLWPAVVRSLKTGWGGIEREWIARQRPDNGWTYSASATPEVESTRTMTAAGVASLYILIDKVYAPRMTPGKARPATKVFQSADSGMAWLAARLTPEFTADGYLAFGIQRIAAASGHKYIGQHDWFRLGVSEIARRAGNAPRELGGDYGPDVQAAFYLLFLSRGRVPVTFNKLERPGADWDAAPRDIANLTRYLITNLEQRMSWQIVNEDRPVAEFLDAPILFINGIQPPRLKTETVQKVREYVLRGGFLVGEATTSSAEFAEGFKAMVEQAFPEGRQQPGKTYAWYKMPKEHPVLAGLSERDLALVGQVWAMDDPTRTFAVLLTRDQATAWQHMDLQKNPQAFALGRNLFKYATAGERLRMRLRPVFAGRAQKAEMAKKLGLIHVGERWLSEDYAVERLSDKLTTDGRVSVNPLQAARPEELDPKECPMIWLTGRGQRDFDDATVQALKTYIERGGLVAINANMGDAEFARAARSLAERLLPQAIGEIISDDDPIFTGLVYRERGRSLKEAVISDVLRLSGVRRIQLTGYRAGQRWGVIVSPYDVFLSMLAAPIYGCKGYGGETAQQIAANIYLYSWEKAEKAPEAPKP